MSYGWPLEQAIHVLFSVGTNLTKHTTQVVYSVQDKSALDDHWCHWIPFGLLSSDIRNKGEQKWQRLSMASISCTTFWGKLSIWPGRRTVILSSHCLSCFLPVFLLGGGRADKSCFDAGAVRGLAREDSKHCLCRTFKINPSATGLVPPPPHPTSHPLSLPLSLFPEPFFLFFSLPSL